MIGHTISHYRILEKLGEGGMGVVYAAEDTRIQRTVAVKFLPREVAAVEGEYDRILYEARAAGQLNHPNICTIFAVEESDHERFIVMEYVQGKTLKDLIQSVKLSPREALDYAIQIAEALQDAHSKEIVHRDIKTENIMVNERGQVKVMDFGLAKLKGTARLTKTGTTIGTLGYMAPEQIDGRGADARSDIFSLGIILYELLSGEYPFRGEHDAAIVYSIMNEEPRPLPENTPGESSGLTQIVTRALEKDPEARYQTAREMLIDLRRAREDPSEVPVATAPAVSDRRQRDRKTHRTLRLKAVGIAAVSAAVAGISIFYLVSHFSGGTTPDAPIPIAVISFDNQTGEPAYDYLRSAIPNLLITSLEQSPSLRVTPWERMRDILRLLGKENAQVIDRDLGFDLCRRDTVPFIVIGSVTKAGNVFATNVTVIDVKTKETLSSATARGEGAGSILQYQIDQLSNRIAEGIGLSAHQIFETARPVADITSSSLGAYDYYLRGRNAQERKWDHTTARRMFEKAIALDSTFASAHLWLSISLADLGLRKEADHQLEIAKRYSHRASEIERLYIDAAYADRVEKDSAKCIRIYEKILERHPNDKRIHLALGEFHSYSDSRRALSHFEKALEADPENAEILNAIGYMYFDLGNLEKALEYIDRYASLTPDSPNPFDSKGEVYFRMGWLENALANFKKALEVRRDFYPAYMRAVYVHALREEYGEAMALIDTMLSVAQSPTHKGVCFFWRAFYSYWLGRRKEAFDHMHQVKRLAEAAAPLWHYPDLLAAWIHYEQDELEQGRKFLDSWNNSMRNRDAERRTWWLAYTLTARAVFDMKEGKEDSARARLKTMESLLPRIQRGRDQFYPVRDELLSEMFLQQKEYSKCIELSKTTTVVPLINIFPFQTMFHNHPFQADQLARAYEMKGQTDSAIASYERLITFDPRGESRRLINPLYRYRLGLLYEKKGLVDKAVGQYEKFVKAWKDAEKDRTELPDAKSRLRRLKRGS